MRILSRYQGVDWKTWAFLWARWTLTPYLKIVGELPKSGRILDLGCGHGLLALAIAQRGESYKVLAYDHDGERVKIAQQAASGLSNLTVQQGGMIFPEGVFSGITMIDVMHYFPESEQHTMAEEAFKHLEPGGRLLVRDVNPDAGVVASLNRLYEKLATQTGFTRSNQAHLHFHSVSEWEALFRSKGFRVTSKPCSSPMFADVLFTCERPS